MNKNLVTFSLMIFVFVVIAILGASVLTKQNNTNLPVVANSSNQSNNSSITVTEVTKHNTSGDCWVIISEKVYNVTSYLNLHPAGPGTITPYCGKDATVAFDTKGGRGSHSQRAKNTLDNYYVGNVLR